MGIEPTHIGITTRGLTTWLQTPYRNTLFSSEDLSASRKGNVFLYGRGTENRTLICWLKASYFSR